MPWLQFQAQADTLLAAKVRFVNPTEATASLKTLCCPQPLRRLLSYLAVVPARPHPGAAPRPDCIEAEDSPHDDAVLQHVVIVVAPLAGWARNGCVLENQRGHGSATKPDDQRKDDCGRQNASQDNLNKREVDQTVLASLKDSASSSAIKAAGSHRCIAELEVAWTTREPRSQSGGLERGPFFLTNAIEPLAGVPAALPLLAKAASAASRAASYPCTAPVWPL
jgi:hypothetical protein